VFTQVSRSHLASPFGPSQALEARYPQLRPVDKNESLCPGLAGPPDGRRSGALLLLAPFDSADDRAHPHSRSAS